jgi:hypothetical protein
MKKYNLLLVLMISFIITFGQQKKSQTGEVLTNKTIISLVKAKVPNSIIINKIENSTTNFDFSSDALINLSQNGVEEEVINEMMGTKETNPVAKSSINQKENGKVNLNNFKEAGIYYYNTASSEYQLLDPVIFAQKQTSGGIISTISYGFAKAKGKGNLAGSKANFQINNPSPEFYFYFSRQNGDKSIEKDLFSSAQSPNEFVLVKFKIYPNKNVREMVLATTNNNGGAVGVDASQIISFKYEKISENIYKVKFSTNLQQGEYCFMPAANSQEAGEKTKLFDFGIDY